jgi:hypothetical protein
LTTNAIHPHYLAAEELGHKGGTTCPQSTDPATLSSSKAVGKMPIRALPLALSLLWWWNVCCLYFLNERVYVGRYVGADLFMGVGRGRRRGISAAWI